MNQFKFILWVFIDVREIIEIFLFVHFESNFFFLERKKNWLINLISCRDWLQICGVWRKVPRVYKQLLREEKLWVALMEDKDGEAITGRIARYKALSTELLSAVLTPSTSPTTGISSCTACGGTAAVSMASATNSIYVTVAVSGLASRGADVETFVVRLETLETSTNPSRVIEELVTVQKPQEVSGLNGFSYLFLDTFISLDANSFVLRSLSLSFFLSRRCFGSLTSQQPLFGSSHSIGHVPIDDVSQTVTRR